MKNPLFTFLSICVLPAVSLAQEMDAKQFPAAVQLPNEKLFRETVRALRAAAFDGSFREQQGARIDEDHEGIELYASKISLGTALPDLMLMPHLRESRTRGTIHQMRTSAMAELTLAEVQFPGGEARAALRAAFDQYVAWLREETKGWTYGLKIYEPAARNARRFTAGPIPGRMAPGIWIEHYEWVRVDGDGTKHPLAALRLTAMSSLRLEGRSMVVLKKWAADNAKDATLHRLVAWLELKGVTDEDSIVGIRKFNVSKGLKDSEVRTALRKGWDEKATQVLLRRKDKYWRLKYAPPVVVEAEKPKPLVTTPIVKKPVVPTQVVRPKVDISGLPEEAKFKSVIRELLVDCLHDFDRQNGARIQGTLYRPKRPLGRRLPVAGRDPEKEAGELEGRVLQITRSIGRLVLPICDGRADDAATRATVAKSFEEMCRWMREEAGFWEIYASESRDKKLDGGVFITRILRLQPMPEPPKRPGEHAMSAFLKLEFHEESSIADDGSESWTVALEIEAISVRSDQGLNYYILSRMIKRKYAGDGPKVLMAWMKKQGFGSDAHVVHIPEPLGSTSYMKPKARLAALATSLRTPLLIKVGGEFQRHDFIGPSPPLKRLASLHRMQNRDSYVDYLRALKWSDLTDFVRSVLADRDRGFESTLVVDRSRTSGVRLSGSPLGSRTEAWHAVRLDGDLLSIDLDLGWAATEAEARTLEITLKQLLQREFARFDDVPLQIEFRREKHMTRPPFGRGAPRPDGYAVVFALGVPAPEQVRAIRARMAAEFELLNASPATGWGRVRHTPSGQEFEGVLRAGVPYGPGRLVDPKTGRVIVALFCGMDASGAALLLDPKRKTLERGQMFGGRLSSSERLPAWRGVDGNGRFHGLDRLEQGPIVLARGEVLTTEKNSDGSAIRAEVRIKGIGNYVGRFVNGWAEGQGILRRFDGYVQKLECRNGTPALIRTLSTKRLDRLVYVKAHGSRLLPVGDCVAGSSYSGGGTVIMSRDAKGRDTIYSGQLQDGLMHGRGKLKTHSGSSTGNFTKGKRNGIFVDRWSLLSWKQRYVNGRMDFNWRDPDSNSQSGSGRPAVRSGPVITFCKSCDGYGYHMRKGYWIGDSKIVAFLPWERTRGKWGDDGVSRWSPKNQGRWVKPSKIKCRYCNGTGRLRSG